MFWRASGPSLERRKMRRCALPCAKRVDFPSSFLNQSVTEVDGEVDLGGCLWWASGTWSMYRVLGAREPPPSSSDSTSYLSRPALPCRCWRFFSPSSFTQYPSPPRSLVRDEQTSPHGPRLVVSRSTCPPLFPPSPLRKALS
jgi:hypothetical protein